MKVLFVGETYFVHETHMKGVDSFQQNRFVDDSPILRIPLERAGVAVTHLPSHRVPDEFPVSLSQLRAYDAIVISDVGANSFLLSSDTTCRSMIAPNRLACMEQYVSEGGGLVMIGGYMSFGGINGAAAYAGTPMETLLPVHILHGDDRREAPQGVSMTIERPEHPIFAGIPDAWPKFLGYNRLEAKPGARLAACGEDAMIAAWEYGKGRSAAFASDCAPHWGPDAFVNWEYYGRFWLNLIGYVARK